MIKGRFNYKFRFFSFIGFMMFCALHVGAQTTKKEMFADINKCSGVYLAYPTNFALQTPPPDGYSPFYISHYARHGSRYLIGDQDYEWVVNLFADAHAEKALSPLGEDVYERLLKVWQEAQGHGGDLSPVGVRQHRGIAERMFENFPEVFQGEAKISARSTIVLRCAMSMVAFGDRLKELNPELAISYEASNKYMSYMNFHTEASNQFTSPDGPWAEEYRKFEELHTQPDRLVASLFNSNEFVLKKVNPNNLMWGLYWIACDTQDMETDISFYDIFEKEELFDLWQCINYRFYVGNANHADGKGIVVANAKPLLQNILDGIERAISGEGEQATLRFGHDGNIIPLLALMRIENYDVAVSNPYEVYSVWCDYKAVPMAANVQLIFFSKEGKKDDILVKILHNENEVHIPVKTDTFPFYKWKDVETFFRKQLE